MVPDSEFVRWSSAFHHVFVFTVTKRGVLFIYIIPVNVLGDNRRNTGLNAIFSINMSLLSVIYKFSDYTDVICLAQYLKYDCYT